MLIYKPLISMKDMEKLAEHYGWIKFSEQEDKFKSHIWLTPTGNVIAITVNRSGIINGLSQSVLQ
jgi:hypothetical protein